MNAEGHVREYYSFFFFQEQSTFLFQRQKHKTSLTF